jgi:L-serine deaminase
MGGDTVLHELEYYSVGGGFIEWKGYEPPKKGQPKYPYSTMAELQKHADANKLSVAQVVMANEMAVSGKSEAEINAFVDKIHGAMVNIVKAGLAAPTSTLPGPIKLKTKAGFVQMPCIERCAFGAVKAWTGFMIASNEIPSNRRVDFDTTVNAMALTAKEMNAKYKETSEGGLAVSVVLC